MITLPSPPLEYSNRYENQRNLVLELADRDNLKKNLDIEIGEGRLILTSANGTRYQVKVSDAGALSAVAV
jgi:hypothetical protein